MTISDMHILFKLGLDKVGNSSLPYFEPEAIDLIINYAIQAVYKQKISGNNALRQGAEETNKRRVDLQTMICNYQTSTFVTNTSNKPFGKFVEVPPSPKMFYLLDEEVYIINRNCTYTILTANAGIENGKQYKVSITGGTTPSIVYNGITYASGDILYGVYGLATYTLTSGTGSTITLTEVEHINVLPIRNDQYNTLILDPFNRPDDNKILKLDFGEISSKLYFELISSKNVDIVKYCNRYYKFPASVKVTATAVNCDLPEIIHQEIIDYAVNWTLESIESPRFQSQIANIQRNE